MLNISCEIYKNLSHTGNNKCDNVCKLSMKSQNATKCVNFHTNFVPDPKISWERRSHAPREYPTLVGGLLEELTLWLFCQAIINCSYVCLNVIRLFLTRLSLVDTFANQLHQSVSTNGRAPCVTPVCVNQCHCHS